MAPAPDLALELQQSRRITDELFDLIRPGSLYERPIPERHRLIFYLGHLEAFDWNLIGGWALSAPAFHAEFDRLFAFGIDPDESGLPKDQPADWPDEAKVRRYNALVRETLDPLLGQVPAQLLHVAIEHRLMHAETFAYLLHGLDYDKKKSDGVVSRERAGRFHRRRDDGRDSRRRRLAGPAGERRLRLGQRISGIFGGRAGISHRQV